MVGEKVWVWMGSTVAKSYNVHISASIGKLFIYRCSFPIDILKPSIYFQVVPDLEKFMDSVQTRVNAICEKIEMLNDPEIPAKSKKGCYSV